MGCPQKLNTNESVSMVVAPIAHYNHLKFSKIPTNTKGKQVKKKGETQRRSRLATISKVFAFKTLACDFSLWIYGYKFLSLPNNLVAKIWKLNFQASLEPCIDNATKVVENKLYNRLILNLVLGSTPSFKQPLFSQRNNPSAMYIYYCSFSLAKEKGKLHCHFYYSP